MKLRTKYLSILIFILFIPAVIVSVLITDFIMSAISMYRIIDGKVYWQTFDAGRGRSRTLVKGANANTFVSLKNKMYGKDAGNCYYKTLQITGAHSPSFVTIDKCHAKDKDNVYLYQIVIEGADSSTFEIIDGNWAKDKNICFYGTSIIEGANQESFVVLGGYLNCWAKDDKNYYFRHTRVPISDYSTFQILSGGFAKDKINVYYESSVVSGADSKTFQMVKDTFIGKDANAYYRFGEIFSPSESWIKQVQANE